MILPKNGRIVIVDDSIDDTIDFMEIFSREGISFSYFNGSVETLPESGNAILGTFLMLLDLELDGSAVGNDATQASQVISVIERILGNAAKNFSVIIVAWSKSLTILNELKPRMISAGINPLALFEMDKLSCKNEEGRFDIELIRAALKEKMSEIPAVNLMYYWDNLAGQAAASVYTSILTLDPTTPQEKNKQLNAYFEELAKAYKGKGVTENDSCATINMLNFFLSNEIGRLNCDPIKLDISSENKAIINTEHYASINARINILPTASPLSCGSIHINPCEELRLNDSDIFNNNENAKRHDVYAYENMRPIICEVSTICDQAQDRKQLNRFIPGLIVSAALEKYFKKNADYLYISCLLRHANVLDEKPFYIVLDFRRFFSIKEFEETPDLLFQISETLLMHIQNRLGRHISNPGVVFANHK
ncbi:MAG TPA: hypothetical protein DEB31_04640 [Clostridiales bacterium]|nr:hypothetical protein [Clostridiales bacterium]